MRCEPCNIDVNTSSKRQTTQNRVVLYSTDCPRCSVLEKKLSQLGIAYELNTNVEEMIALGMKQVPMLSVDGKLLDFNVANEWLNQHDRED